MVIQENRYPYPFKPKKVQVEGGHTLSYLDEGKGPVLIMLHGNPTWSFFYRNMVKLLKSQYRVIVPDHLGCGLSDKPQDYPYRLANHIANLETLVDHLKLDRFSLIMHDWGGAIGMGYAVAHREKLETLVVMNTAAFRSSRIPKRIRFCRTPYLGDFLVRGLNAFARAGLSMAVVRRLPRPVKRGYLAPYRTWRDRIALLRFVQDIPLHFNHPSWETLIRIEADLKLLTGIPMLILWGGKDFCFSRSFFDEWKNRFPEARSVFFESAGHYLLEDAHPEIGQYLKSFLDEYVIG